MVWSADGGPPTGVKSYEFYNVSNSTSEDLHQGWEMLSGVFEPPEIER